MTKEIYAGIYGGLSKTTVKDLVTIACDRYQECSLYKSGKCACLPMIFNPTCPFGKRSRTRGYSERAAKYHTWKAQITSRETYAKLKTATKYIATVGTDLMSDMYCGIFWSKDKKCWTGPEFFHQTHPTILPLTEITPELLFTLYRYKPYTVFDHQPMKNWESERNDWFTKLNDQHPELIQAFVKQYPDLSLAFTHIGRQAYVKTLKDGSVIKDEAGTAWIFDKTAMILRNDTFKPTYRSIFKDQNAVAQIQCAVTDAMVCTILSDEWVTPDTIYLT